MKELQYEALIKYNIPVNSKEIKITSSPSENLYDLDNLISTKEQLERKIKDITVATSKLKCEQLTLNYMINREK